MFRNILKKEDLLPAHQAALEALPMPSAVFLPSGEILFANQLFVHSLGDDIIRMAALKLKELPDHADALSPMRDDTENYTYFPEPFAYGEAGKHYWITLKVQYDQRRKSKNVLLCCADITHLKQSEKQLLQHNQQLRSIAELDHLTGIYNKRSFDQHLSQLEKRLKGGELAAACMIMLDLDNFKQINDRYGHAFGDDVLALTAQILKNMMQDQPQTNVYRIGGEEFAMLLPGISLIQACCTAQKCCSAIEEASAQFQRDILKLTISCGVAQHQSQRTLHETLASADMALYHAKNIAKNCTCYEWNGEIQRFYAEDKGLNTLNCAE